MPRLALTDSSTFDRHEGNPTCVLGVKGREGGGGRGGGVTREVTGRRKGSVTGKRKRSPLSFSLCKEHRHRETLHLFGFYLTFRGSSSSRKRNSYTSYKNQKLYVYLTGIPFLCWVPPDKYFMWDAISNSGVSIWHVFGCSSLLRHLSSHCARRNWYLSFQISSWTKSPSVTKTVISKRIKIKFI